MMLSLDIRNYVLVREARLQFQPGLTVVTGETGAGKSIIVGAIDVLLGGRFPKDALGQYGEKTVLEGTFHIEDSEAIESIVTDIEWGDNRSELLLRRELGSTGRARSFVNDLPVAVEIIQQLRGRLVDFHGQREQHSLFQPARQLDYLDAWINKRESTQLIRKQCEDRRKTEQERKQVADTLERLKKDRALLSYQLEEIERLGLTAGEEEIIEARLRKLESAERLIEEGQKLHQLLSAGEPALLSLAGQAKQTATGIAKIDTDFQAIAGEISDWASRLKDLSLEAQHYVDQLSIDSEELEKLRERRTVLWDLKRKHGVSVEQILNRADEMKQMLKHGDELEARAAELAKRIAIIDESLVSEAVLLSQARHAGVGELAESIVQELKPLGFDTPRVEIDLNTKPAPVMGAMVTDNGIDQIDMLFSANPGTRLAPLSEVASGGETSRLTLAIKSVLAERMEYPLLVYDEIDTGISGKTADAVGKAIARLAKTHQVLVITHLPQIAAQADHHLAVNKAAKQDSSETTARFLSQKERVDEIAALIAGVNITDKARASASELLKASGKMKVIA